MLDNQWLGQQLVAEGLVTQAQLNDASRLGSGDLCRDLISSGAIEESKLLRFLGLHHQTRYVSTEKLSSAKVVQWVLDMLSTEFCEQHQVLPVRCDKQRVTLSIVTPDPSDQQMIEETKRTAKVKDVLAYVSLPHSIEAGIRKFYRGDLHAFARMDQSLRQDYSEMMNIYEQRLIDFESEPDSADEMQAFHKDEFMLDEDPAPKPTEPKRTAALTEPVPPLLVITPPAPAITPPTPATPVVTPPAPSMTSVASTGPRAPTATAGASGLVRVVEVVVQQLEQGHGWRSAHSSEVAKLAGQLASRAGVPPDVSSDLLLASLLHELGKPFDLHLTLLGIDADASLKARAAELCQAPARLLDATQLPAAVTQVLNSLYERLDGNGIPGQLVGDKLPLSCRVLQVADAFCELVLNPNAVGGQCDPKAAVQRLEAAAKSGWMDTQVVGYLAELKSGPSADRRLVLIIDEDARSAALLEGQLKSAGFDAVVANTTGDAALVLLGENVALVLSEVDLRPMDGFTFLQWLRSNQRTADIPFMFVSGRAGADDVNRGFELGAVDYIVKPFRPEVVLAKIKRTVS